MSLTPDFTPAQLKELSDRDSLWTYLLCLAKDGDDRALNDLLRLVESEASRRAFLKIRQRPIADPYDLAREIGQQVSIKVWRHLDQFNPKKGNGGKWISAIIRNEITETFRRFSKKPVLSLNKLEQGSEQFWKDSNVDETGNLNSKSTQFLDSPLADIIQRETIDELYADLREILKPKEYAAIELLAQGFSEPEIAEQLGITTHHTCVLISRARSRLERDGRNKLGGLLGDFRQNHGHSTNGNRNRSKK